MSVLSADLHKAVVTAWNASTLDALFKAYWSSANQSEYVVLHDMEAAAAQPFPYCVFSSPEGRTTGKMSGSGTTRQEIREIPWEFHIFAREFSSVAKSSKQIASELAEEIIKIFGGHPTSIPSTLALDNGNFLQSCYETDFGVRVGDNEYKWIVKYTFTLDVMVAA